MQDFDLRQNSQRIEDVGREGDRRSSSMPSRNREQDSRLVTCRRPMKKKVEKWPQSITYCLIAASRDSLLLRLAGSIRYCKHFSEKRTPASNQLLHQAPAEIGRGVGLPVPSSCCCSSSTEWRKKEEDIGQVQVQSVYFSKLAVTRYTAWCINQGQNRVD